MRGQIYGKIIVIFATNSFLHEGLDVERGLGMWRKKSVRFSTPFTSFRESQSDWDIVSKFRAYVDTVLVRGSMQQPYYVRTDEKRMLVGYGGSGI